MNAFISEDLRDNPTVFRILKYLIDNGKTEYIPYRAYREPFVYRIELDNANRMDHIDITKLPIMRIPPLISQQIQWLYTVLWSKNIVHGDLTNNNIIYNDGKFYFIDWELSDVVPGNMCGLWYIFADMIDFLNVFYQLFPNMIISLYNVSNEEFNAYYNVIKTQENNMKYNDSNLIQCIQAFKDNMRILESFVVFIRRVSGIDMTPIINNLMIHYGIGGKRGIKQKGKRTKRKRTKRKRTLSITSKV